VKKLTFLDLRIKSRYELKDEFYVDFPYTKIEFHNTSIHMSSGCHRCKQIRFSHINIDISGQVSALSLQYYAFPPEQQQERTQ
jgi:hypothetical protein